MIRLFFYELYYISDYGASYRVWSGSSAGEMAIAMTFTNGDASM